MIKTNFIKDMSEWYELELKYTAEGYEVELLSVQETLDGYHIKYSLLQEVVIMSNNYWLALLGNKDDGFFVYGSYYGERHKVYEYVCNEIEELMPESTYNILILAPTTMEYALDFDIEEVR